MTQISTKKRYLEVDFIRGIALLLMVAFHLCFDLNYFHYIDIDIRHGLDWRYFRYLILSLFIGTVGISLVLANQEHINYKKVALRAAKLLLASILISIASYILNPNMWIYFGVIHFILVGSLLGLLFIRIPTLSLVLGIIVIALFNLELINMHWLYNDFRIPLHLPKYTEDLVQFVPWFALILIGIFIGKKRWFIFNLKESPIVNPIIFLGRHALIIYLVHQPILFGIFELLKLIN